MASPDRSQVIVLLNTTGRQSVSIARAAAAVGFSVRAHISDAHRSPLVAGELEDLPQTTIFEGDLGNATFRSQLFHGVKLAFVNTTSFDEEETVGKAFVDIAVGSGVSHVIYSSMPDHAAAAAAVPSPSSSPGPNAATTAAAAAAAASSGGEGGGWPSLPQWSGKAKVEQYALQKLGKRVTVVHTGIYHNNFTSLPYPLFQLKEVALGANGEWQNGSSAAAGGPRRRNNDLGFEWTAPFPADKALPWLDCEHDFGAAVLQIFKEGPDKWGGQRLPIAFSYLTPRQACAALERGLRAPVRYVEGPITISVPVPDGYEGELQTLENVLGGQSVDGLSAPYWWSGLFAPLIPAKSDDPDRHPAKEEREAIVKLSRKLWPGWRTVEGYAEEAFIEEERFNGRQWMYEESEDEGGTGASDEGGEEDGDGGGDDDSGLEMASVMPL